MDDILRAYNCIDNDVTVAFFITIHNKINGFYLESLTPKRHSTYTIWQLYIGLCILSKNIIIFTYNT